MVYLDSESMKPDDINLDNKLHGYLFGSACGDALGCPVEHYSLEKIKSIYGDSGILDILPGGRWTDDTQVMLVLARALLRGAELEAGALMGLIAEEFVKWLDEPDLGAGETCKGAAVRLKAGLHWSESGFRDSKKCGSLMRVGIVGFIYQNNPEKLIEVASLSGKITHCHPTADAACIAGAYAVKLALDGIRPREMLEPLCQVTAGLSDEFTEALKRAFKIAHGNLSDEEALQNLGLGWYAEETFAISYFCILRYPDDYKKAVQTAVNITGDSDSVGCVTGGIMGARLGIEVVPKSWIRVLEGKEVLGEMAVLLLEKHAELSKKEEVL